MQCAVSGFFNRCSTSVTTRVGLKPTHKSIDFQLDWLDDDVLYEEDSLLADDEEALRFLEAEVYALTDQFKTESQQSGTSGI